MYREPLPKKLCCRNERHVAVLRSPSEVMRVVSFRCDAHCAPLPAKAYEIEII
jgi:hypothetical protein